MSSLEKELQPKGCAVPKEIITASPDFVSSAIDKKERDFSVVDKNNKGEIVCDVLTLSNEEHLKKFNFILNEQNKELSKSSIVVKLLERQYNDKLGTWQVFAIYEVYNKKTF